jgi:hypothetical protein
MGTRASRESGMKNIDSEVKVALINAAGTAVGAVGAIANTLMKRRESAQPVFNVVYNTVYNFQASDYIYVYLFD